VRGFIHAHNRKVQPVWSKEFWKQTGERAIKTAAQVALSFWVVGQTGILDVDWQQFWSIVGLSAIASVLTSLVGSGMNDADTPSMVRIEHTPNVLIEDSGEHCEACGR
jgi:hypothetical protein